MADSPDPVATTPDLSAEPVAAAKHAPWYRRHYRGVTPLGWVGRIILGVLLAIVLIWAILFITRGRFLKHPFENIATKMAGRQVKVAGDFQFYFNPINLKFYAEGLTVANADWAKPGAPNFFEAKRIDTRFAVIPLIIGTRRINKLDIDGGRIDLSWDKQHQRNTWTFGDPNAKGKPFEMPQIRAASVSDTRIRYRDPQMLLSADIAVQTVKATNTRFASAIRFTGSGNARNTPFTLTGALLSPNETLAGGENQLMAHVDAANTRIDVAGTLPGATVIKDARLRITARGRNLADLFMVMGVAIPATRTYVLNSNLTKHGNDWEFTGLNGRFGDSDIAGKLTVTMREPRLLLTATLATKTLDIIDVAPFIGYNPDLVADKGVVTTVNGVPRLLPDTPLNVEAMKNFDADVRYSVRNVRAKSLPVSNIALTLALDNSLLTLSPLTFDMARGHVASDISIDARKPIVSTDYDIRLSPTPIGVLLAGWGVEESGTTGTVKARIKMTGTGNSVHESLSNSNGRIAIILPKGSFWARNIQLSEIDIGTFVQKLFQGKLKEPAQINCGLIAFTVKNGVAAADPILIDTQKNVMIARGGFSFKNEAVDLAFRADSKKFSLFAGQSPVGINGYFAKPGISPISPELVGRAGAAVGLGLVGTPLASVLAFVDIGDAKSAACGPVLQGATAAQQRTSKGQPRDDVGKGNPAKGEDGKRSAGEKAGERKKFLGVF